MEYTEKRLCRLALDYVSILGCTMLYNDYVSILGCIMMSMPHCYYCSLSPVTIKFLSSTGRTVDRGTSNTMSVSVEPCGASLQGEVKYKYN